MGGKLSNPHDYVNDEAVIISAVYQATQCSIPVYHTDIPEKKVAAYAIICYESFGHRILCKCITVMRPRLY
jgi:hypothetical protein